MASAAEQLLTPIEAATYLQVPVRTVYAWRARRIGPPAYRVGRHLRYRAGDLEAWLAGQRDG